MTDFKCTKCFHKHYKTKGMGFINCGSCGSLHFWDLMGNIHLVEKPADLVEFKFENDYSTRNNK